MVTPLKKTETGTVAPDKANGLASENSHPFSGSVVALSEAMALCAAAGLFIPSLGGDNAAAALTITVWTVLAWTLQRIGRWLKAPWWLGLPITIITSAIAALVGLGLILYHPQTLPDPSWLTSLGDDLAAGGLPLLAVILIGATVLLAWGRGSWLGFFPPTFSGTATSFQLGLVVIFISFGLAALLEQPLPFAVGLGLAFCFFGVLSLALSHHQEVVGKRSADGERSWLAIVVVGLVLALLIGLLIGSIINGELLRQIAALISAMLGLIGQFFEFLARSFGPSTPPPIQPTPEATPLPEFQEREAFRIFPEEWRQPGQYVIGGMFALLTALAVFRVISDILRQLFRALTPANASVEKVSGGWTFELRAFVGMLRGLWKMFQWRLDKLRSSATYDDPPLVGDVRNVYRELLYWTAQRGLRRTEQETPHEFLCRFSAVLPAAEPDLRALTEQYELARYCPQRLTDENCEAARENWRHLRKQLRWWMAPSHPAQE
jgi:hypothetical protein